MKKILIAIASAAAFLAAPAQAQSIYAGVGLPGLYTLGYQHTLTKKFGVRVQHSTGLSYNYEGNAEGVDVNANLKASSTGIFADWHPFEGSFRVVGGVTQNDIRAQLNAKGTGNATINGNTVNMAGERYNTTVKLQETTPYLGIDYGHNPENKGLGFFVDFGFLFGKFDVKSETTLVANGKATQADIDAQDAKARDSVSSIGAIPTIQLGLSYRF